MPEGVGQHRLDDVAVADRHPHRAGAVLGLDRGVAAAYGGDRAGLHRRHRLAAGERRRGRLGLHRPPELLLGQVLERPALPLAVVALGDAALGRDRAARPAGAAAIAVAVCRQRSSGLVTTRGQRDGRRAARRPRSACARPRRRRGARPACRPARTPVALAVVRPCRTRITVAMRAELYGRLAVVRRDRRQRALPQGPAGRRSTATPHDLRRAARRGDRAPATSSGSGLHEPSEDELDDVAEVVRPAPARRRGRRQGPPAAQARALRRQLFLVLKTLWYVDEEDAVETGEINIFVGDDFVVTVRHGQGRSCTSARPRPRGRDQAVLTHGPSAVVYAVCDRVVDGYTEVADELEVDVDEVEESVFSPDAHQRLGADLRPQARDRRGAPRGAAAARADAAVRRPASVHGIDHEAGAVLPRRRRPPHPGRRDRSTPSTRCCRPPSTPTWRGSRSSRTTTCARSRPASAWSPLPTLIAGVYGMNFDHMPELRLGARLPVRAAADARASRRLCASSSRSPAGCRRSGSGGVRTPVAEQHQRQRAEHRPGRSRTAGRSASRRSAAARRSRRTRRRTTTTVATIVGPQP